MITFRRIRRRDFLHVFVSIMRVIIFIVQKMSENDILFDVPKTAKHLS